MTSRRGAVAPDGLSADGMPSARSQSDSATELTSLESVTNGGKEESDGTRETDSPHALGRAAPSTAVGPAGWQEEFVGGSTRCPPSIAGSAPTVPGRVVSHEEPTTGGGGAELPDTRVPEGNPALSPCNADAEEDEAAGAAVGDVRL